MRESTSCHYICCSWAEPFLDFRIHGLFLLGGFVALIIFHLPKFLFQFESFLGRFIKCCLNLKMILCWCRQLGLGVINARSWFKGADTTTLTHFLEKRYTDLVSDSPNHPHVRYLTSILAGLQASNVFFHTLYAAPLWLPNEDRDILIDALYGVLRSFADAANYAYGVLKITRFKYQPKYHMLAEIRFAMMVDRNNLMPSLNPLAFSTQMDEDYIGKICQMSRYVASRTVHIKTIERLKLALISLW